MPELKYSKLVAFRITHDDPIQLSRLAAVFKQEIESVFKEWVNAGPDPKPVIECYLVGAEDFPMREVPQ